uniref:BTB domain-containing protein n=1 Tax=Heterorhabditis bacteriophora TaxID=37862 RepID=A0A1I7WSE7_HETBA
MLNVLSLLKTVYHTMLQNIRRARYIYNFFEVAQESDMALVIENKELFINSSYLSMLSPYFRSLHCSKVKEPRYGDLQVKDVFCNKYLIELLHVVYPSKKSITVENVEVMLALGDRFLFESVLIECENFLVTPAAENIDVFIKLEWASKYAMADLQQYLKYSSSYINIKKYRCFSYILDGFSIAYS